jgi:AcrR family transcriptional regulator
MAATYRSERRRQYSRGRPRDCERTRRRGDEILECARELFARRGFQDTDVQALADTLGVGKGTIYRYFPSKRALFLAALDDGMHRLQDHVEAACRQATDPLDQVVRAVEAFLGFFDEHAEYAELLTQERAVFKNRRKPTYLEHRERNVERWRERFRELIAAGRVRRLPVERITDTLSALLYGVMFTNHYAGHRQPLAKQACAILEVALFGILSDAERRRHANRHRRRCASKGAPA